jgi:hypothetical protein
LFSRSARGRSETEEDVVIKQRRTTRPTELVRELYINDYRHSLLVNLHLLTYFLSCTFLWIIDTQISLHSHSRRGGWLHSSDHSSRSWTADLQSHNTDRISWRFSPGRSIVCINSEGSIHSRSSCSSCIHIAGINHRCRPRRILSDRWSRVGFFLGSLPCPLALATLYDSPIAMSFSRRASQFWATTPSTFGNIESRYPDIWRRTSYVPVSRSTSVMADLSPLE